MRVCYVLSTSEITGGANRSILDLLGALKRDLVDPIVLIKKRGDIENLLKALKIPVFFIPFVNEVSAGNLFLDGFKRVNSIKTSRQIERFLKAQKVDLVHNNSLPALAGMEAANKIGIPYICHIREQIESGLGLHLLNQRKHFSIVKNSACILAISHFVCNEYEEILRGIPITILQDGFDTSYYLNEDKTIFDGTTVNIAIYGNLDPQKGQLDAVKAVESLQKKGITNIILHIIGNQQTVYADEVKKFVTERKIKNVIFSAPIKKLEDLKTSRAAMDINLVCSSAEGLGRVTIESMLSGCLTIGARAGATPEIIRDYENGLLYECHNIEDLADKIEWAVANYNETRKISKKGQEFAMDNYAIEKYADKICRLYQQIT